MLCPKRMVLSQCFVSGALHWLSTRWKHLNDNDWLNLSLCSFLHLVQLCHSSTTKNIHISYVRWNTAPRTLNELQDRTMKYHKLRACLSLLARCAKHTKQQSSFSNLSTTFFKKSMRKNTKDVTQVSSMVSIGLAKKSNIWSCKCLLFYLTHSWWVTSQIMNLSLSGNWFRFRFRPLYLSQMDNSVVAFPDVKHKKHTIITTIIHSVSKKTIYEAHGYSMNKWINE